MEIPQDPKNFLKKKIVLVYIKIALDWDSHWKREASSFQLVRKLFQITSEKKAHTHKKTQKFKSTHRTLLEELSSVSQSETHWLNSAKKGFTATIFLFLSWASSYLHKATSTNLKHQIKIKRYHQIHAFKFLCFYPWKREALRAPTPFQSQNSTKILRAIKKTLTK